ncbi:hypothetical protein LINPERHAP1_LOCUS8326, partial [Linum perenne]
VAQTNALLLPSLLFIRKVSVLVFASCSSTCCRSYHQFPVMASGSGDGMPHYPTRSIPTPTPLGTDSTSSIEAV